MAISENAQPRGESYIVRAVGTVYRDRWTRMDRLRLFFVMVHIPELDNWLIPT